LTAKESQILSYGQFTVEARVLACESVEFVDEKRFVEDVVALVSFPTRDVDMNASFAWTDETNE